MITFISYMPGARGKFVTEICELSMPLVDNYNRSSDSGGNVSWIPLIINDLKNLGINWQDIHYLDPEEEKYKFYVDSIISCSSKIDADNIFIDTHYVLKETFEYAVDRGCKVIRIIVNGNENLSSLQNNFFYKNFIEQYNNPEFQKTCLNLAKKNILQRRGGAGAWAVTEEEFKDLEKMFDVPLNKWSKQQLKILYRCCRYGEPQLENIFEHPNLIEVNYDDVLKEDTIKKIVSFVGGQYNENVKARFNNYISSQNKVVDFDTYIEQFINDYKNV